MFWIMVDTATKRDYYRDVHNLLALPVDNIITYDYRPRHISDQALARADSHDWRAKALVVYAQSSLYTKGTPSPSDENPLPLEGSLWVATRLAFVEHVTRRADRYYFDLKLAGYPTPSDGHLAAIIASLARAEEVPFNKFIALSQLDDQLASLENGDDHDNWAKIVDRIALAPSQFAGDSFWRIGDVLKDRDPPVSIVPAVGDLKQRGYDRSNASIKAAIYDISELAHLSLQIETRTVQPADEPEHNSPRAIIFHVAPGSPLSSFSERSITIRRYSKQAVDIEVGATLRITGQDIELKIRTDPESNGYVAGPDLALHFDVEKGRLRTWMAGLLGLFAPTAFAVGTNLISAYTATGVALIGFSVVAGSAAYCLLTGRVPLPGSR
jgi:hypothetical protein